MDAEHGRARAEGEGELSDMTKGFGPVEAIEEGGVWNPDPTRPAELPAYDPETQERMRREEALRLAAREVELPKEFVEIGQPDFLEGMMMERRRMWIHVDEISGFERREDACGVPVAYGLKQRGLMWIAVDKDTYDRAWKAVAEKGRKADAD